MVSNLKNQPPVVLLVAVALLPCAIWLNGVSGAKPTSVPIQSTTSSPPPSSPSGTQHRSSSGIAPSDINNSKASPGQKKGLAKGYGGRRDDEDYYGHREHHKGGYEQRQGYGRHQQPQNYNSYERRQPNYGGYGPQPKQNYDEHSHEDGHRYGEPKESYGDDDHHGYNEHHGDDYGHQDYGNGGYKHSEHNGYGENHKHEQGPFHFDHHGYGHHFDSHYCSVHGSFSLALTKEYEHKGSYAKKDSNGKDNYKKEDNNYGSKDDGYDQGGKDDYAVEGYGKKDNYGKQRYAPYKPRFHTRQYCRYAAAASDRACQFCCRVVARSSNTSPDDIQHAIFAFDPIEPSSDGVGFDQHGYDNSDDYGHKGGNKEYGKKSSNSHNNKGYEKDDYGKQSYGSDDYGKKGYGDDRSAFQCVCCAPKQQESYYKK